MCLLVEPGAFESPVLPSSFTFRQTVSKLFIGILEEKSSVKLFDEFVD
jgi:hypothetical protein